MCACRVCSSGGGRHTGDRDRCTVLGRPTAPPSTSCLPDHGSGRSARRPETRRSGRMSHVTPLADCARRPAPQRGPARGARRAGDGRDRLRRGHAGADRGVRRAAAGQGRDRGGDRRPCRLPDPTCDPGAARRRRRGRRGHRRRRRSHRECIDDGSPGGRWHGTAGRQARCAQRLVVVRHRRCAGGTRGPDRPAGGRGRADSRGRRDRLLVRAGLPAGPAPHFRAAPSDWCPHRVQPAWTADQPGTPARITDRLCRPREGTPTRAGVRRPRRHGSRRPR
jgi:hypothetical protein